MSIYVHCDNIGCRNKEFLYGKEAVAELHMLPRRLNELGWTTGGLPSIDSCPEHTLEQQKEPMNTPEPAAAEHSEAMTDR